MINDVHTFISDNLETDNKQYPAVLTCMKQDSEQHKSKSVPQINIHPSSSMNKQTLIKHWINSISEDLYCIKKLKHTNPVNESNSDETNETIPIVSIVPICDSVSGCHGNDPDNVETIKYSCTWQTQRVYLLLMFVNRRNRINHLYNKWV